MFIILLFYLTSCSAQTFKDDLDKNTTSQARRFTMLVKGAKLASAPSAQFVAVDSYLKCSRHCWTSAYCKSFTYQNTSARECKLYNEYANSLPLVLDKDSSIYGYEGHPIFYWNGSQYYLGKNSSTWKEARDFCGGIWGRDNGDLVIIEDMTENYFLTQILKNNGEKSVHIGGSYISEERKWNWTDNCSFKFENWNSGEPHNQGCAYIKENSEKWSDGACDSKRWFICEIKRADVHCGESVLSWNGGQYFFGRIDSTWQEATDFCRNYWGSGNGDLVNIDNANENEYLYQNIQRNSNKSIFIGGKRHVIENEKWIWSEDCPSKFLNWLNPFEAYYGASDHCAVMTIETGKWHFRKCTSKSRFICEKKRFDVRCGEPVYFWNGGEYFLSRISHTWQEARQFCGAFWGKGNGDLVTINDASENENLHRIIKSKLRKFAFIGVNYDVDDAKWIWTDKCPTNYKNWINMEPNGTNNENCAYIADDTGKWIAHSCNMKLPFVCERKRSDLYCGEPIFNGLGGQYYFGKNRTTWHEARSICRAFWGQNNGDLVSIDDAKENDYLNGIIGQHNAANVFIGGSAIIEKGRWIWSDDCPFKYTNWNMFQPNNHEGCAGITEFHGKWSAMSCDAKFYYMCERKKEDVRCGERVFNWNGNQYYLGKTRTTWNQARNLCNQFWGKGNGDLVVIDDANENEYLLSLLKTYQSISGDVSIGGNDIKKEGQWVWNDNCPLKYTNWKPGEPSNLHSEHCLAISRFSNSTFGKWKDESCLPKQTFICERKRSDLYCGDPFLKWNGGEYFLMKTKTNWIEATYFCRALWGKRKGDLVTINDANENDYLRQVVKNNENQSVYIGGSDIRQEGKWIWNDNSAFNYTNWNHNETSHNEHREHCVRMIDDNGKWIDVECTAHLSFICERKRENKK